MPITTKVIALTTIAGTITAGGIISQIDNINNLLDQFSTKNPKIAFELTVLKNETDKDYTHKFYDTDDILNPIVLKKVTCTLIKTLTYDCEAPLPPTTPGLHYIRISHVNKLGVESNLSDPVEYRFTAVMQP